MLKVKIKNIEFNSPIIAASGTFGYGDEFGGFVDLKKIGCIITKSITLEPRIGNKSSRIHESDSGMINSIGLANVGVEKFCSTKIPSLNKIDSKYIISIAGRTIDEYTSVLKNIEKFDGKHVGYEINVSCPNVKHGGMEFGVDKDMTFELTSKLRSITNKLLIIKLSPNVTKIEDIAKSCELAGADAVSAVNTFQGLAVDYKTGKMILSTTYGGVSGKAIKPLALAKIHKIYSNVNIPILGMGGISSFQDVIEFLRVGSTMVQVGTLNYLSPVILSSFYNDLRSFLSKNNISNIASLTGRYIEN
tara:strand:+ start:827 stop:1738 length:912 start_codon:yes stop_codon:yes gene_type:complete